MEYSISIGDNRRLPEHYYGLADVYLYNLNIIPMRSHMPKKAIDLAR